MWAFFEYIFPIRITRCLAASRQWFEKKTGQEGSLNNLVMAYTAGIPQNF